MTHHNTWWFSGLCSVDILLSAVLFVLFGFSLQALAMPDALAGLCFDDVRVNDFEAHLYRLLGLAMVGIGSFVLQVLLYGTQSAKRECLRYTGFLTLLFAGELTRAGWVVLSFTQICNLNLQTSILSSDTSRGLHVNHTFFVPLVITLVVGLTNLSCVWFGRREETQELVRPTGASTAW